MREENQMADFITNSVFNYVGTINYQTFQNLHQESQRLITLNQQQKPSFRFKH